MPLSFETLCNIIQTGTLCKTVSNASGTSSINHFNNNINALYNSIGTQYKSDSAVSDASIVVTPNPLASFFTTPTSDYGILSVNAQNIVLGNRTSTVSVPGTLVISYVDSTNLLPCLLLGVGS